MNELNIYIGVGCFLLGLFVATYLDHRRMVKMENRLAKNEADFGRSERILESKIDTIKAKLRAQNALFEEAKIALGKANSKTKGRIS